MRTDHSDSRRKVFLAAVSCVGLVLAVAGITPTATAVEDLPARLALEVPAWFAIPFIVIVCLEALLILYLLAPGLFRRRAEGEGQRRTAMSQVLLLLVAAALFEGLRNHLDIDIGNVASNLAEMTDPAASLESARAEKPPSVHSPLISGLLQTFLLALALMAFGVLAWLYLAIRPVRGRVSPPPFAHSALQAAVEDSLDDLRHLADARLAIIRCYDRFERVLAGADLRRSPWETAMEFMRTALKHPRLPREAVRELTRLFEIARFSRHELGPSHREQAWQALMAVKAALEMDELHASPT